MKSKTTAALLAFFLGGLGVHRFYLGQPLLGVLYLLLCWTFIPVFLGLIDFIVLITYSDQKFNSKYNKQSTQETRSKSNKEKLNADDLVSVTSRKVGNNKTEMTIDLNEENLVAHFKEKQKRRETEIRNFKYVPRQMQSQGLQLLESLHILNTTKNLDTLIGRHDFISNMYDDFVKASHNRRYVSDMQVAIDQYKSMYYDRILKDFELQLLVQPDHENLTDYYSDCLFNCFTGFYREQIDQIENLKRDDAKQRRKEKVLEIADQTISEFDKNGSDNDRFEPLLNSLREIIDTFDSGGRKSLADTTELKNPIVINPKCTFELTLYNTNQKEIKRAIQILKDDNIWNKEKELLPIITAHNIKCKEIEDYISEYKPKYHQFIEQAKANSDEYKTASEMDRLDIENEYKAEAINNLFERADCELDILFEGSEIPETIDDELIHEYGFGTISKYIGFSYRKDKIISNRERKEFEDLLNADLAISGNELPKEEVLFAQTLITLNKIAEKGEGHFKRKQKAVDYLKENPKLLDNIGKHVSTRSMFKIKPLPEKFENIDLENLSASWAYVKEYIRLLTNTYRDSERYTEDIRGDKSWIKEFRVDKQEDLVPNFICQRARKECGKKYSKNRPPKLPFHVGCNCNLRTEI